MEWKWSFVFYIIGMKFRVVEVKDELLKEEVEGGFNSGSGRELGTGSCGLYCIWRCSFFNI